MSVRTDVLSLLECSKGTPISGETIAKALYVSRNSVWKAIKALKNEGYQISAATNKGYTLISVNNILSAESIRKHMKYTGYTDIIVLPTVDSTNNYLKSAAVNGFPEGTIVISEEQTMGKGRLGRCFESPKKTGIYMSLLLRPSFSAQESLSITTVSAVATAKAIEEVAGKSTQIKWVNDIYMNEKKICGILTEASINFENGGLEYAIPGIGVNVKYPEGGFPAEISDIAGAIYDTECGDDLRCRIIAAIIDNFFYYYHSLPSKTYLNEYRTRSLLTGREITYTGSLLDSKEDSGVVRGIDDEARLIVEKSDGTVKLLSAGEVTLKKNFLKR